MPRRKQQHEIIAIPWARGVAPTSETPTQGGNIPIIYNMSERKVRVRFAPSPTGALHIGGVRTALYNYLFAKQQGGDLVFRIEDTDSQRFVPGAEEYIIESFRWLGIKFDEGVSFGGKYGPYRQSERKEIYKQYVDQLLNEGKAYIAFDTPQELEAKRAEIENFQYDAQTRNGMRNSLTMSAEEVDALIGFYDSPVGQSILEKQSMMKDEVRRAIPAMLNAKVQPIAQEIMREMNVEIHRILNQGRGQRGK